MTQLLGTIVCLGIIAWLFYLDRDPEAGVSPALWIPTLWMLVCSSRSVREWLAMKPSVSLAQQYSESSPMDAAFYAILLAFGLAVLNYRSQRVRGYLKQNIPILLFVAYCALSVLWADDPFIAFKRWSKSIGDLVMVMIVLTDRQPKNAIQTLYRRTAFVLLPLSVLFITCFPDLGSGYDPEDMTMMYFGVTTFKNLLGVLAMICGLFSLWSFVRAFEDRALTGRKRHMVAHSIVFFTACWLIVRADSMTSLACMVFVGTAMILVGREGVLRWQAGAFVVILATILFPLAALFASSSATLLHAIGRNPTLTGRTMIWHAVLAMHTNPLFGTGFESFWLGSRLPQVWHMSVDGIQEAHNGYLETYLNLGWIGLIFLGGIVVTGYRRAVATLRIDVQMGTLRIAFLTAALIFSMTEAGFRMLSPMWISFLLASSQIPSSVPDSKPQVIASPLWIRPQEPKHVRILR
jgi:Lipid A core - O-antigen ligase and related enzymes